MPSLSRTGKPSILQSLCFGVFLLFLAGSFLAPYVCAQTAADPDAPVVSKIEPPSWWLGLTPDVMLLLSGKNLQATHAQCNLPEVLVNRTQSSINGNYLFVWLKFLPKLQTGTAVCRITTAKGETSFEFPIAARKQILGRNQGISPDDVIYFILPDRFANGDPTNDEPQEFPGSRDRSKPHSYHGGDLRGIQAHLPYLKDLGVTILSLTSILKNATPGDFPDDAPIDNYTVDPHFGTLREQQDLVDAAHKLRLKVFFEMAPNHVGPQHPWVKDPPMPDWFHGTPQNHLSTLSPFNAAFYGQNGKSKNMDLLELLADPHTPAQMRKNLTDGWLLGTLPDLNTENPVVADYLIQNAIWWAEVSGLDGYRVDAFPYVPRAFWSQWHERLRQIYPRLSTLAEVAHPDPTVTSVFAGGRKNWDGIDTQLTTLFDFPLYYALRDVLLNSAPAGRLTNILRQDSVYPHPDFLIPLFDNHDAPRFADASGSTPDKLKLAFAFTLTVRGIPEIYYGDEIGLQGNADHDFPGGWPGDQNDGFTPTGRTPQQGDVFTYVQSLLRLRAEHEALRGGKFWDISSDDSTLVFLRSSDEEKLLVAFHIGANSKTVNLSLQDTPATEASSISPIFGNGEADLAGRQLRLTLPPQSLSIFSIE